MTDNANEIIPADPQGQAVAQPIERSTSAELIDVIKALATAENVNLDNVERLLKMQREVRAEEAKVAYYAALARCKAELVPVVKDARNDHTKSDYARLEAIATAADPIIGRHGFGVQYSSGPSKDPNFYRCIASVTHEQGHVEEIFLDLPLDKAGSQGKVNKTDIQALGSTISYGRRYLKFMAFDIAVKDKNPDGNSPDNTAAISEDEAKLIDSYVRAHATVYDESLPLVHKTLRIKSIAELPQRQLNNAWQRLGEWGKETRKAFVARQVQEGP